MKKDPIQFMIKHKETIYKAYRLGGRSDPIMAIIKKSTPRNPRNNENQHVHNICVSFNSSP